MKRELRCKSRLKRISTHSFWSLLLSDGFRSNAYFDYARHKSRFEKDFKISKVFVKCV